MRSRSRRQRGGYVLLIVMAVSLLVITVLSTLAKISLRRAVDAGDAVRSLQQRWGTLTLQRTLLKQAPQIFAEREKIFFEISPDTPPPPFIREAITIGDVTFDIMLGDEDAKLNLNALYHQVGKARAEQAVGEIVGPEMKPLIRLLPAVRPQSLAREQRKLSISPRQGEEESDSAPDALSSWGQVFDIPGLNARLGSDLALPNITTELTCWGSGQLNFRRASDQAILAIIGSIVQDGGASRILQRYRQNPTASLDVLLQLEVGNEDNREQLARHLSELSNNYSIWIHASGKANRGLSQFTVARRDQAGVVRYSQFAH